MGDMDGISTNVYVFFFLVGVISLTGVLMPGPALASVVAKGYESRNAGIFIAIGHGLIEVPLIILICFGFETVLVQDPIIRTIGIVGGVVLLHMGYTMFRRRKESGDEAAFLPYSPLSVGVLTSALNPGFFIWWATVGAVLVLTAMNFGPLVMVLFIVVHWSCDLVVYHTLASTVHEKHHLWSEGTHGKVLGICGGLTMVFGFWFILSSLI